MNNLILDPEQERAVEGFKKHAVIVIDGGPGTGKTTIIKNLDIIDEKMLYVAPTGCAAQRMSRAVGKECHVMAKVECSKELLEYYQGCNLVIDEAGMCSIEMCRRLMCFLHTKRVAFIGDAKQLPCVDGYPALNTLLQAKSIPIFKLTRNHRQKDASSTLARIIDTIGTPAFDRNIKFDASFRIEYCYTDQDAVKRAALIYNEGYQMLAPKIITCTALNRATAHTSVNRVVCTTNYYAKSDLVVANGIRGEIFADKVTYENGFVDRKNAKSKLFKTKFEDARCLTVHKSQGNEFDEVGIVVLSYWGAGGLPLNIFYTAASRFKTKVVVYGTAEIIQQLFCKTFDTTNVDPDVIRLLATT